MTPAGGTSAPRVLIAGGGPAALETLLALRDLAGEALEATLLSPRAELVERPAAVGEPFGLGAPRRHALAAIARDCGATLVRDALEAVDVARREARTSKRVACRGGASRAAAARA